MVVFNADVALNALNVIGWCSLHSLCYLLMLVGAVRTNTRYLTIHERSNMIKDVQWSLVLCFDLSLLPALITLFWPHTTGSNKLWWDHMAGELASSILQLLHRSLSAESSEVNCFCASVIYHILCFQNCLYFITKNCYGFLYFFLLMLLAFHKFLHQNRHLTLKVASDVDDFIGPN
jgi:hypothetical protein